jgi:hypothetical protein
MLDLWYVARGSKQCGPFSAGQLRELAAAGKIRLTDTVRREGTEARVPAAKVKNLFPAPAAQTQPPAAHPVAADVPASSPPQSVGVAPPSPAAAVEPDGLPEPEEMQLMPAETNPEGPAEETDPTPVADAGPGLPRRDGAGPVGKPANRHEEPPRKRQAFALKGAILLNQNGVTVHFRKKCSQCGFEDACRSSMPIGQGVTRSHFYCRKCRKNRDVEIRGVVQ